MRAKTPLDELEYFGDRVEVPRPKYPVGTEINAGRLSRENRIYYWRKIVCAVIRDARDAITSLQRRGYFMEMVGKKMLPHNKAQIWAILDIVRHADTVEVVGAQPTGMHVVGTIGNQCYLQNGRCHSGVGYEYFLLFRRKVNGNKVVYIHQYALINEAYLLDLEPRIPGSIAPIG